MAIPTGARGLSAALILLLHRNRRRTNPRVTVGTDRRRNLLRDRELQPTVPEERAGGLPTVLLPMAAAVLGLTRMGWCHICDCEVPTIVSDDDELECTQVSELELRPPRSCCDAEIR